jgi:hypothetical protein
MNASETTIKRLAHPENDGEAIACSLGNGREELDPPCWGHSLLRCGSHLTPAAEKVRAHPIYGRRSAEPSEFAEDETASDPHKNEHGEDDADHAGNTRCSAGMRSIAPAQHQQPRVHTSAAMTAICPIGD